MANAARPNFNRPADINRRGMNGTSFANNRFNNPPEARLSNRQAPANRNFANRNFAANNNRNFNRNRNFISNNNRNFNSNRNFVTNNNRNFNSNRNFVTNNNRNFVNNRLALNQRFMSNNFNGFSNGFHNGFSNGFFNNGFSNNGFFNAGGFWNRPWFGGRPWWFWNRPWGWSHWGWFNGVWDWPWIVSNVWLGGAPAGSWLGLLGDTYAYENPYYATPSSTVVVPEYLDYSEPIPVPTGEEATGAYPPAPSDDTVTDESGYQVSNETASESEDPKVRAANELFDAAREAFRRGDYATAQADVEKAIEQLPSDAVLHEFRALTLFAQGRYSDAAATLYAVLAAGPGWDWATMSALYSDVSAYTQQLRALEDYARTHPNTGDARFLLAYHYLVLGYKDEAVKQLGEVVRLMPTDKLSAAMLKALTSPNPAPAGSPRPAPLTEEPRP
jgi:tetratricopeptide (TPR) repeat protein